MSLDELPAAPGSITGATESFPGLRIGVACPATAILLALDEPAGGQRGAGAARAGREVTDDLLGDDRVLVLADHVLELLGSGDEPCCGAAPCAPGEFGRVRST